MIVDELTELLRRKRDLDGERGEGRYTQSQRWTAEAVELLLKLALEQERREKRPERELRFFGEAPL